MLPPSQTSGTENSYHQSFVMHFAIAFDAALKARQLSQAEASVACGLHQTAVSRYLRGDMPKGKSLERLLSIFTDDKHLRRQLIYAYIRDTLEEANISPDEVSLKSGVTATLADSVDPELYAALSAIGMSAKHNPATRDMVLHMALVVAQPRTTPAPSPESEPAGDSSARERASTLRKRRTALAAVAKGTKRPRLGSALAS